ncbi:hypothetical protein Bbelb_164910 [Branchiostoma belcheri]|nr:hypothetical protein Bbelb_164910 [Branchiostoma belcheri]
MVLREELLAVADCYRMGCPRISDPVCGSDGKSYPSPCRFRQAACIVSVTDPKAAELTIVHKGECNPEPSIAEEQQQAQISDVDTCYDAPCTFIYMPVCASDGKTYPNECVFGQAVCAHSVTDASAPKLTVVSQGQCPETEDESAKKEEQQEQQEEEVVDITTCYSIACPRMYAPVCGSDGKTYSNICVLAKAACVVSVEDPAGPELTIDHKGECGSTSEEPIPQLIETKPKKEQKGEDVVDIETCQTTICPRLYLPVCGSDGKTYPNLCLLAKAACIASVENPSAPELTVASKGECGSSDPVPHDGKTYPNFCLLSKAACIASVENPAGPELTIASKGECGSSDPVPQLIVSKPKQQEEEEPAAVTSCFKPGCPRIYLPVCGSDGKTYSNTCLFQQAACASKTADPSAPELTIVNDVAHLLRQIEEEEPGQQQDQTEDPVLVCLEKICGRKYLPVCASDGKTYHNTCLMDQASCVLSAVQPDAPAITAEYIGECGNPWPITS